ncbi:YcgL domain-containing protein [Candidatus Spongiihabitans sp.]|uniref:YcgL domain-containing protein n=1 Tax=Candidatus Spongiihabitans sp. TaxID=3101308 RepID=UPI003C7CF2C3
MHTWIYKGLRKENAYLYITAKDNFERVPESLLRLLGKLDFVLDIKLTKARRLAQAKVDEVMRQLEIEGYYLQLPPGDHEPERIPETI